MARPIYPNPGPRPTAKPAIPSAQCPGCGGTGCDARGRCQYCGRVGGYIPYVVYPAPMTPAEQQRLRQEWERIHRGSGQTVVLPYIAPTASEKVRM